MLSERQLREGKRLVSDKQNPLIRSTKLKSLKNVRKMKERKELYE